MFLLPFEVDVSIVGKEEEEILKLQQERLKNAQKSKMSQLKNRGRPRRPEPPVKTTRAASVAVSPTGYYIFVIYFLLV